VGEEIVVIKRNPAGEEIWRYHGRVLGRGPGWVRLEAFFNRDDRPFHGILLGRGDRFVETFYSDRGYNIFEMHARKDDALKGWYCNVARPAEISDEVVSYVDLALDLLVYPDRRQLVLDEDEFAELHLAGPEVDAARQALRELQEHFSNGG
jgi:uncharacterized protein